MIKFHSGMIFQEWCVATFCLKAVAADKWQQINTRYGGLVALVCSCLHLVGKVKGAPRLWITICVMCGQPAQDGMV